MGIKVAKFGGTSVADGIQIAKIKKILADDSERRFVVVSAPGKRFERDSKVTDILYSCINNKKQNIPYEQLFQVICDRFSAMEMYLGVDVGLKDTFVGIRQRIDDGASEDYVASRGEFLNAKIIAAYLGYDFADAADMVRFDEKGKLLPEETNKAMTAELRKHEYAVIPGFYGSKPDGSVKTFSRGGSDITGSLAARAVKAYVYENWTDVSGFLVADPRIIKNPEPISTVSYRELRELSYMGASVLHEDAIYPARISNIPINIRNTNEPDNPGTMITSESDVRLDGRIVTGIAGKKDFVVVALSKSRLATERGFVRKLAGILEDHDVTLEHMPSGIDTISVIMSMESVNGKLDDILDEFERQLQPESMEVSENVALIATVGCGMSFRPGVSAKLFTALAKAGINIRMIDQGSSEMNIIVGVHNDDFESSIKAIYEAFIDKKEENC